MQEYNKKQIRKIIIEIVVVTVLILAIMVGYLRVQKAIMSEHIENSIRNSTVDVSELIDSSIGYAYNSIQVTAKAISDKMTSPELDNPQSVVAFYIDNTPFSGIEYIRYDGMNITNAGAPFDASDREYFKKGISGHVGIWINYHPKYSKNPLVNFYAPLYYKGTIVGVLTGTIDSSQGLEKYLLAELFEQPVVGVLIDSDNQIIASTVDFNVGTSINWDNAQVFEKDKEMFLGELERADGSVFVLDAKAGTSIGSVAEVNKTGWKVLQVMPAPSVNNIMEKTNILGYSSIGAMAILGAFLFISIIVGKSKMEKYKLQLLQYTTNTDDLTGLKNRHCYENDLASCVVNNDFIYMSLDLNGLKVVNDTEGHMAGDELLKAAAECMKNVLGTYGDVYRTGGDEFVALIYANQEQLIDLKQEFENAMNEWHGEFSDTMSISYGYVQRKEFEEIAPTEMAKLADKRMYQAKAMYYKAKGIDRRGHKTAHAAICNLYAKVLSVNLTEDSYTIVSMSLDEQVKEKGYSGNISIWLRDFGLTGQVHAEDLEEYFQKTNADYLKQYFKDGNKYFHLVYRRKFGDSYRQVMMEIIPTEDYNNENQSLYLYVKAME